MVPATYCRHLLQRVCVDWRVLWRPLLKLLLACGGTVCVLLSTSTITSRRVAVTLLWARLADHCCLRSCNYPLCCTACFLSGVLSKATWLCSNGAICAAEGWNGAMWICHRGQRLVLHSPFPRGLRSPYERRTATTSPAAGCWIQGMDALACC